MAKSSLIPQGYKIFAAPLQNKSENDSLNSLLSQYEKVATANRLRLDALRELFDEFDNSGIEALPLKGMDLLLRSGQSIGWRPMSDVDLLIRKEQAAKVFEILERNGFSRRPSGSFLTYSFTDEGVDYLSANREFVLDIIWNFWYDPSSEIPWQRSAVRETPIGRRRLLHPEDALLFLIAYAVAHRGHLSPAFVQDLQVLIQVEAETIDWNRFVAEVTKLHLKPIVYHGLVYASTAGLSGIPKEVILSLRPESLSERFTLWFLSRMVGEGRALTFSYLLPFFGTPGFRGKMKLLRHSFFPPADFIEFRSGKKSWAERFLVGLLRPFRILVRSLFFIPRDLLRLFRGRP